MNKPIVGKNYTFYLMFRMLLNTSSEETVEMKVTTKFVCNVYHCSLCVTSSSATMVKEKSFYGINI